MKNKLIILFAFGFMLMIPDVKAETYQNFWLRSEWTYDHTNFDKNGEFYGKNFTLKYSYGQEVEALSLYISPFNIPSGSNKLYLTGLLQFNNPYQSEIRCETVGENGDTHCILDDKINFWEISIQAKAFYNGVSRGSFCNISMLNKTGFFNLECPVFDISKTIEQVNFYIYRSNSNSGIYEPQFFIGLGRDITFYQSGDNSIVSSIKDQTEQQHKDSQAQLEEQKKQTEALTNSNVDVNGDFFNGFDNNTHGLTSVITAPLQLIGSITSSTCSPLTLPMPFGMPNAQLPCMGTIYKKHFGTFFDLYQTITFGMVSYWVCVNLFAMVKGFKDPDSDKVEVLDL